MLFSFTKYALIVLLLAACSDQKKIAKSSDQTINNLKAHIQYLSDDKLEGRRTGTPGEELAMQYISARFKEIGLSPKGTENYVQKFPVNGGKEMVDVTKLVINSNELERGKDYFVYPFSPDKNVESTLLIALREENTPWVYDLGEIMQENKDNPHFDVNAHLRELAKSAGVKNASAVIFYNSTTLDDQQVFEPKDRTEMMKLPVVYVSKPAAKKYFSDPQANLQVKLRTSIGTITRFGNNVIGYIDNGAPTTIVLGAHYDHLGYGEDGNSMIRTGEKSIHNGADDNASGTAALIELGRILKNSKLTNNNYLFIAFSGEELGLFGSKYFTENATIDIKSVNYMINMDMVGRLNDSTKTLTIGGYGTSPAWSDAIGAIDVNPGSVSIKIDSSGTGPSDHTSFYRKDIPVLFYFTGLHTDYHKPSDDADKINYDGERRIIYHINAVIQHLNYKPRLAFTKTREAQTTTSARFSVSMGIMPDYTFSGTGVRADGVSEGKPAQKAGLKAGDIIIQLGDHAISSLENYMQALGKFKKGDRAKVKYKRANEILESVVEF